MENRPVDPGSIQGSHRPISFIRIKHRTRASDNLCKCLMYHAACKVEFQPLTNTVVLTDDVFQLFTKTTTTPSAHSPCGVCKSSNAHDQTKRCRHSTAISQILLKRRKIANRARYLPCLGAGCLLCSLLPHSETMEFHNTVKHVHLCST